jgi:hypothetical protein
VTIRKARLILWACVAVVALASAIALLVLSQIRAPATTGLYLT